MAKLYTMSENGYVVDWNVRALDGWRLDRVAENVNMRWIDFVEALDENKYLDDYNVNSFLESAYYSYDCGCYTNEYAVYYANGEELNEDNYNPKYSDEFEEFLCVVGEIVECMEKCIINQYQKELAEEEAEEEAERREWEQDDDDE